jgi:hypothetical protein
MVGTRMAVRTQGDEIRKAVVLALGPGYDVSLFERERVATNRTVVPGFKQHQASRFDGDHPPTWPARVGKPLPVL